MRRTLHRDGVWAAIVAVVLLTRTASADDPRPEVPNPQETPFGRFLGELFQQIDSNKEVPGGQREPSTEALPEIEPNGHIVQDAVDERAVAGREQQRELEQAQRLLQGADRDAGLAILQRLLDTDEDTLLLTDEGQWQSLQQAAERLIGQGDAEVRRAYVERFSALADERLQQARQGGHPQDYADVAKRYLHTPAGQAAARILTGLFRDAGESVEATYWSGRIDVDSGVAISLPPEGDEARSRPLTGWPQPFGGPDHRGRFPPTDPVLIERWSAPVMVRPAVAEQVEELVRDLVDNNRACIPTAMPLAVNGRIISRTLRGLSVFDADSGRPIWESEEGVSVERLLSGEVVPRPGAESTGLSTQAIPAFNGTNADGHPLAGLLFRDGVYGQISSDGEQVFVLEDHASLSYRQPGYFWGQRVEDDPFDRDWATNQLVAYDLKTGSIRWRIGGERLEEPFDPPLAGTLFLGPPVIDGEELFLIGEQNGTLHLHVLDRGTGQPLWSHAISEAGATINQDLVRRWWPAQPAVGRGVIVCPTTTGWMVAIDRLQRRIRWTYRYIEARQRKVSSNRSRVASAGPLNTRWCPAAPVLTQRHVLFTPSELPDPLYGDQPRIVCLDILTGERVWWEEKRQNLYIGGVDQGRVLLVGTDAVEARDVTSGKRLWKTPLHLQAAPIEDNNVAPAQSLLGDVGPPSGRGIITGDVYLLPLRSRQLWSIDVETGDVTRTIALRDDDRPLGNLLSYRGRLLSADPFELRCFEERSDVVAELAQAKSASASTAARLRAAELQYIEGDFRGAHQTLQSLDTAGVEPSQRSQADKLRWDTLVQLVRLDLHTGDASFAELDKLAVTDQQRMSVERLRADRLLSRGEKSAAFDVYWKLAQSPVEAMVSEGETSVCFRCWLAGRLGRLWDSAGDEERERFDVQIRKLADQLISGVEKDRRWWADVLRFHPAGGEIRRAIVEQAVLDEQRAVAETSLLQLLEDAQSNELQFWALERLVRLMLESDRDSDAVAYLEQYAESVPGGEALRQAMVDRIPAGVQRTSPAWSDGTWTLTRSATSFNRAMFEPVLAVETGLPSVNQLRLRVEPNLHRLSIDASEDADQWETPLQAQAQSFYSQTTGIASVGQLLFVVHHGVLQAISVADRELLWRREFDLQSAAGGHVRGPMNGRQQELRTAGSFVWSDGLRQTRTPVGMLAVWRGGYVAYFGRHSITLADPLTGETLWTRNGIAPRTMAYGTSRLLYIVPPASEDAYALSVVDGSPVDVPQLNSLTSSAVSLTDGGIVDMDERKPFGFFGWGKPTVRVRLVDPLTGQERRGVSFPSSTRFTMLNDAQIVAVDPDGAVSLIDCQSGESRLLGSVGEEVMQSTQRLFAIAEPGHVYLAFNKPPRPENYSRSYQSAPVHGTLAAFDMRGGLLWSEAVENQNLIVDQLSHLPVLVMSSQRSHRDGEVTTQKVFIELRDKQTGELLLQDSRHITGGNVRELDVDYARQIIDLNTYKDRLRLQMVPK